MTESTPESASESLREQMERAIREVPVLLFTKGNKHFPRCGFSKAVIDLFAELDVPFQTVDIFQHPDVKPTLVEITGWPTTPQIFIGGEFIGGGDVVREMHARGELEPLVREALARAEAS